jgi:hypothetical protein
MRTALYLVALFGQLAILIAALRLFVGKRNAYLPLFLLNLLGLVYDCSIIAAGRFIGEGELLRALNAPRFWIHALFSPLLVIFVFGVTRRCGVPWAQSRTAHAVACLFAAGLIVMGARTDILALDLRPVIDGETLRYRNFAHTGPPIPVILVNVFTIAAAVAVYRRTRAFGMLLGASFMFLGAAITPRFPSLGNVAEVLFSWALLEGERAARR